MTFVGALPGEERIIVAYNKEGENRHVIMNLDGTDPYDIPLPRDGFSYCLSLSPDASKVVFHTASKRGGYRISVMNLDGSGLLEIAGHPDHLFFGPSWSPDGEWILFTDCLYRRDPEHHRADLWIARPDGSENRKLTHEQRFWLSAVYGGPATKGGGSNLSRWSPDGSTVTYIRLLPGAETAWPMKTHIDIDDHFNREYVPERARGGTEICLLDPFRGDISPLTTNDPPVWDFRATWSPDGRQIAFCRSEVGCPSELWVMETDGSDPRFLTRGHQETGVDHPLWLIA
jgi:TolB protein